MLIFLPFDKAGYTSAKKIKHALFFLLSTFTTFGV